MLQQHASAYSGAVKPKAKAKRRSKNFEGQKPSDILKADWIDAHGISVGHLPIFMQMVPKATKAETTSSEKAKTRKARASSASKPAPSADGSSSTTRSSGSSALPHFEVPTEACVLGLSGGKW